MPPQGIPPGGALGDPLGPPGETLGDPLEDLPGWSGPPPSPPGYPPPEIPPAYPLGLPPGCPQGSPLGFPRRRRGGDGGSTRDSPRDPRGPPRKCPREGIWGLIYHTICWWWWFVCGLCFPGPDVRETVPAHPDDCVRITHSGARWPRVRRIAPSSGCGRCSWWGHSRNSSDMEEPSPLAMLGMLDAARVQF